jgi:STE24 endopeptidase
MSSVVDRLRPSRPVNEDRATRYHRLKRQAAVASVLWRVALLIGLLWSGLSLTLRSVAESIVASPSSAPPGVSLTATIVLYVCLLTLVNEIGGAPIAWYTGFFLERKYGLSNQPFAAWTRDQVKSDAIGLLLASCGALILYGLIAVSPRHWWLTAGVAFAACIVGLTQLTPVRLLALAERAGASVLGAYEWGLGDRTRKANAALAGLGWTRRILVSDTMLAEYSDEEIEVVLAHELAHHVHGDIWKGIVFESALILAGVYLAARILQTLATPIGLRDVGDIAGLPLLLLAAGAVSLVMQPVAHAMSRAYERSADRFALDLTRNPEAFVSALRRLGAQNLAEEHPSKLVQWLFYSHPPLRERIDAAQTFFSR